MKYGWFLAGSVIFSALAQVLLKAGVNRATPLADVRVPWLATLLGMLASPMVVVGLLAYGAAAVLWLGALSRFPLSYAYPFVAFGFVLTMLASVLTLGETLNLSRVLGTLMIAGGAYLVGRS